MVIAGNWKMHKGPGETVAFCHGLRGPLARLKDVSVALCPPFVSLGEAVRELAGTPIQVFAQNVHWRGEGAFTGEVSAEMLREVGVHGAIVGHSERRQLFGETDEMVARRTAAALDAGLAVIACVGELEDERERGETESVLERQLQPILAEVGAHPRLTVAYEPVWAIGTGKTASPEIAEAAHAFAKAVLPVPVLYGGSVKPDNADALLSQPDVDGALVGGASLDPDQFLAICRAAASLS
jgi:triosephosphate isomerase